MYTDLPPLLLPSFFISFFLFLFLSHSLPLSCTLFSLPPFFLSLQASTGHHTSQHSVLSSYTLDQKSLVFGSFHLSSFIPLALASPFLFDDKRYLCPSAQSSTDRILFFCHFCFWPKIKPKHCSPDPLIISGLFLAVDRAGCVMCASC